MPGYDLSQFVADMGGSLGFLLGLSVLGLIGLFEKVRTVGDAFFCESSECILKDFNLKVAHFRRWHWS